MPLVSIAAAGPPAALPIGSRAGLLTGLPESAAAPRTAFREVLQRSLAPGASAGAPAAPPHRPASIISGSRGAPAAALEGLQGIERARVQLDRALAQARAGRTFSPQELLSLQSDAYRFSHAVDVASKVAEAGAQTVKQAVNTQV